MTGKLRVLMLDGISSSNVEKFNLNSVKELYGTYGGRQLDVTTFPLTIPSQTMIWSGRSTDMMNWLYPSDEEPGTQELIDIEEWQENPSEAVEGFELLDREDYDATFIWEILENAGLEVVVDGVPLLLPPIVYGMEESMIDRNWFPATKEELRDHLEVKRRSSMFYASHSCDFYCSVIQVPDKWEHLLHGGEVEMSELRTQTSRVDSIVRKFVELCERMDRDWVILGDHGSPSRENPEYHGETSLIISNLDEVPENTDEIFDWMLDYFEVEDRPVQPEVTPATSQLSLDSVEDGARRLIE